MKITKDSFTSKELSYLPLSDSFEINLAKNSIIFGFNGIGKTTITSKIKNIFGDDCFF